MDEVNVARLKFRDLLEKSPCFVNFVHKFINFTNKSSGLLIIIKKIATKQNLIYTYTTASYVLSLLHDLEKEREY